MAGAHLASHEEELRTCAKATDINFKPGQTYKISKGNIRDSAAMLRKIMEKAVLEEPYRVGNSFQEGAEHMKNNAEIMTTPAYEAGKRMIKEAEERTGTIIPQPLTPGSQQ